MKPAWASVFIMLLALASAHARSQKCIFRVHAEANARDTSTFSSSVRAKLSGRDVAIEKMPRISERDVVAFYPYTAGPGSYGALFELDEHGKLTLDALSIEKRGGYLFIFINGRPITELQIDQRVSDGRIFIPSGLTGQDIALMKKSWRLIGQRHR